MTISQTVVVNCVDPTSMVLAGRFVSGIRQCFPRKQNEKNTTTNNNILLTHRAAALCTNSASLDGRIATRGLETRFDSCQYGYAWHKAAHLMWKGAASEWGLPLLELEGKGKEEVHDLLLECSNYAPRRLEQLSRGGFHICHFKFEYEVIDVEEKKKKMSTWTLLEVLPLQFALYEGGVWDSENSVFGTTEGDQQQSDPRLVSWFIAPYHRDVDRKKRSFAPSPGLRDEASSTQQQTIIEEFLERSKDTITRKEDLTYLEQWPFIAPCWGAEPTPFRALLLSPETHEVICVAPGIAKPQVDPTIQEIQADLSIHRVPMLQKSPCGFSSGFLPTYHLSSSSYPSTSLLSSSSFPSPSKLPKPTSIIPSQNLDETRPIIEKRKFRCSEQRAFSQTKERSSSCVLLYFGSFAPFHAGHKETLILARETLLDAGWDVLGAFVVPVAQLWPKDSPLKGLGPWAIRAAICQMMISDLSWATVDFAQGFPNVCAESLAQRLQAATIVPPAQQPIEIFWINGTDIEVKDYFIGR